MATQIERDIRACVDFFLADTCAMFRALRNHVEGVGGFCAQFCGPWPCLSYSTAASAVEIYRLRPHDHMPEPRSPRDAAQ